MMIRDFYRVAFLCYLLSSALARAENCQILSNQVGYEPDGPKRVVVLGHASDQPGTLTIKETQTGKQVFTAPLTKVGPVDKWKDWIFWTADFSPLHKEGSYFIECETNHETVRCFPFEIQHDVLERKTLSNVIYYFKGQRCTGLLDKADHHLPFENSDATADVHGGWFDATGDYGKHLSHLSFSTYFNPQQIPFTDWSLFEDYASLTRRDTSPDKSFRQYRRRILDEAMFGADYLVRVKDPQGTFYRSVDAPGGEKAPADRRIATEQMGFAIKTLATKDKIPQANLTQIAGKRPFEVGFRNGGGMAIAALARASTFDVSGEFTSSDYLKAARDAFEFLQQHNLEFTNDGKENIVDDYCTSWPPPNFSARQKSPNSKPPPTRGRKI